MDICTNLCHKQHDLHHNLIYCRLGVFWHLSKYLLQHNTILHYTIHHRNLRNWHIRNLHRIHLPFQHICNCLKWIVFFYDFKMFMELSINVDNIRNHYSLIWYSTFLVFITAPLRVIPTTSTTFIFSVVIVSASISTIVIAWIIW